MRRVVRAARRHHLADTGPDRRKADANFLAAAGMQWLTDAGAGGREIRCVTAYEPMASEPPIGEFARLLIDRGVRVLVPVTLPGRRLGWREADTTLAANPMRAHDHERAAVLSDNVLHEVDVAFIPGLAISADGFRLGQGGGYYDRVIPALRAARPDTPVMGVLYSQEFGLDVPTHGHDIRVDAVLTPQGVRQILTPAATTE